MVLFRTTDSQCYCRSLVSWIFLSRWSDLGFFISVRCLRLAIIECTGDIWTYKPKCHNWWFWFFNIFEVFDELLYIWHQTRYISEQQSRSPLMWHNSSWFTERFGNQGPLLLIGFNFDPSMDKLLHAWQNVRWNYLSIPKLQRLYRWSLGMDMLFHPTLYNGCNYLSMPGFKLNHVNKRGPWYQYVPKH